jgi:hypothetical protein
MDEYIEYLRNRPADHYKHQFETMARELVTRIEKLPKEYGKWTDALLNGLRVHIRKGQIERQPSALLRYADQEDWASFCSEMWCLTRPLSRPRQETRPGAIFEAIAHSRKLAGTNFYFNQTIRAFETLCLDFNRLLASACEEHSAEQLKFYRDELTFKKIELHNTQQELHDTKRQLRDALSEVQKIKRELLDNSHTLWTTTHAESWPNVHLRALLSRLQEL